jgi:hypothetical protein
MKKFVRALIIALAFGVTWPIVAPAQANAWVSLDTATSDARGYWNDYPYFNYSYYGFSRRTYQRISNDRVDILGQGYRNGVWGCRWIIVSSSTGGSTRWTRWHPDRYWSPGCGGV